MKPATGFAITGTVPWGRDAAEYAAFFALGEREAGWRILDCGGGPSSFTAETIRRGGDAVAVDPLYGRPAAEIASRVDEAAGVMRDGLAATHGRFVWDLYGSIEALVARRLATMRAFLADYGPGRYVGGTLPSLPFADSTFDLVLCSHLLFLYDHALDLDFHERALAEMLRLGREVRVFPLLDLGGGPSRLVEPATRRLADRGIEAATEPVAYEFQKGGNRMLRLRRA